MDFERTSPMAKTATPVGFQRMAIAAGIFAGQHKPLGIECDTGAGEPVRIRFRADEQKQVANRPSHLLAVAAKTPAYRFQDAIAAFKTANLRARQHFDIGVPFDPIDQIA
jgi:hypothetical protein